MSEQIFYEQGPVRVTNARFIVGTQTYAMNGVTSVKAHDTPPSRGLPLGLIVIGLLIALGADGAGKLLGLVLIGAGVFVWSKQRPILAVILSSASGEMKALDDATYPDVNIPAVIGALNDAIIHRG